jgi:hypothetical protein
MILAVYKFVLKFFENTPLSVLKAARETTQSLEHKPPPAEKPGISSERNVDVVRVL